MKPLFGKTQAIKIDGTTIEVEQKEYHNGGTARHVLLIEESLKPGAKKDVLSKILDMQAKYERGEIIGWSVDASKYHPETLQTTQIKITTVKRIK
jgi:hypothetical protein